MYIFHSSLINITSPYFYYILSLVWPVSFCKSYHTTPLKKCFCIVRVQTLVVRNNDNALEDPAVVHHWIWDPVQENVPGHFDADLPAVGAMGYRLQHESSFFQSLLPRLLLCPSSVFYLNSSAFSFLFLFFSSALFFFWLVPFSSYSTFSNLFQASFFFLLPGAFSHVFISPTSSLHFSSIISS